MPTPSLRDILQGLVDPWFFLATSLSHLPSVLLHALRSSSLSLSPAPLRRLRSAWFGSFWAAVAPNIRAAAERRVVPLLRGRVRGGRVVDGDGGGGGVGVPVAGTVIEIGPGSGMWVSLFSDRYLGSPDGGGEEEAGGGEEAGEPGYVAVRRRRGPAGSGAVTRVLGVEPSADMHEPLRERVREAGLEGVYEVVPVGIEDLAPSGRVRPESVDCIVSILCLCGIPDPERNIRELYGCLKPGGRWYVYEHVRCVPSQGWAMGVYQGVFETLP